MRVRRPGSGRRFEPQHVDGVVDAAVDAWARRDAGLLQGAVDLLVTGPGAAGPSPGGAALVDEALDRRLLAAVGALWARGWQPADLARVVGRDLGRAHAALAGATIVREVARYPAAAVPRRWRDQVDDLATNSPPGRAPSAARSSGASAAGAPAPADEGPERAERVRVAVELLGLLAALPAVPRLGAAPGEACAGSHDTGGAGGSGGAAGGEVDQRMLHRVRSLLAKAESTTFPGEAEALTAKAQELMARYAIDAALVAAGRGEGPDVGGRRLGVDDPYAAAKAMLLDAIASANRCRSVWTRAYGYATVFGDERDIDAVELLYTSLLVQAARAMLADAAGAGGGNGAGRADGNGAGRTGSGADQAGGGQSHGGAGPTDGGASGNRGDASQTKDGDGDGADGAGNGADGSASQTSGDAGRTDGSAGRTGGSRTSGGRGTDDARRTDGDAGRADSSAGQTGGGRGAGGGRRAGGGAGRRANAGRTRSYRQSFLVAFAVRIGDRLAEAVALATDAAAEEGSLRRDALLPVLAGRREAAEAACDAAFPEIKNTTLSANDWAGWHAGRRAAEAAQLDLHAPVARGSSA